MLSDISTCPGISFLRDVVWMWKLLGFN